MELLLASVLLLWLVVAVIVVGLCAAAAHGDRESLLHRARDLAPISPEDRARIVGRSASTTGPGQAPVG